MNDTKLREHLAASSGLFLVVAIDKGDAIDPEKIRREIRISFEEGLPVLLISIVESDARRWPTGGGLSSQELRRYWEMASTRLAEAKDKLAYISLWNLWGDGPSQDLSLLSVDEAFEALAATGEAVGVRNRAADLLIEAYSGRASVKTILSTAGFRQQDFDLQGSVRDIWYSIVDELGPSRGEQLIGFALEDPTTMSLHDQLRGLMECLKRISTPVGICE